MSTIDHVKHVRFLDLPQADQQLVEFAAEQADNAYNPLMRRWRVGAAIGIHSKGEKIFYDSVLKLGAQRVRKGIACMVGGSNVEDPDQIALCECGEKVALAATQSMGVGDYCEAIAIVGKREGEEFDYIALSPCDTCRGRIRGYGQRSGMNLCFPILLAPRKFKEDDARVIVTTLGELQREIPFNVEGIDTRQQT